MLNVYSWNLQRILLPVFRIVLRNCKPRGYFIKMPVDPDHRRLKCIVWVRKTYVAPKSYRISYPQSFRSSNWAQLPPRVTAKVTPKESDIRFMLSGHQCKITSDDEGKKVCSNSYTSTNVSSYLLLIYRPAIFLFWPRRKAAPLGH